MIKSKTSNQGYKNEITEYLDEYLLHKDDDMRIFGNYIYPKPIGNYWIIRVPGASRGNLEVINGIIKNITIYEDSFCYKESVLNKINQFIGKKIDLGV